ncbi:MAG: hypothetical protein K6T65_13095 [Peptococcaceae bacterium]|nr:hypothetical protein [Peptococcaceae bacterium]
MAEWIKAPEVERLAKQLINECHSHLTEANIMYLFRDGPWSSQDRTTWGKAVKVSGRDKFIHEYDFLIIINKEIWTILTEDQRKALVDHELMHCYLSDYDKEGNPVWSIRGHDLEDFAAVVRRHGMWNDAVKRYLKAAERREDESQQRLFGSEDTDNSEPPTETLDFPYEERKVG